MEFDFDSEILNFWTVDLLEHENNYYKIKGQEWNSVIKSGETIKKLALRVKAKTW